MYIPFHCISIHRRSIIGSKHAIHTGERILEGLHTYVFTFEVNVTEYGEGGAIREAGNCQRRSRVHPTCIVTPRLRDVNHSLTEKISGGCRSHSISVVIPGYHHVDITSS